VLATGFWRIARGEGGRTRLVAPDGRATYLLGVNTVMRDTRLAGEPRCAGIGAYIRRHEPTLAALVEWARLSDGRAGGLQVPRPYGFNSVGAFSEINDFDDSGGDSYMIRAPEHGGAGAPYAVVLDVAPRGPEAALRDERGTVLAGGLADVPIGDPFQPAFLADLDALAAQRVAARRGDPRLQMWFAGNENGLFDVAATGTGVHDLRRWLWSRVPAGSSPDAPRCARHALAAFLRERYAGSIAALNAAWDGAYPDFAAIVDVGPRPVPYEHDCNARCGEDLQGFVHDRLLREWVRVVTRSVRTADPDHLVASPRLAVARPDAYRFWTATGPRPDRWAEAPKARIGRDTARARYTPFDVLARDGDAGFDLVAVNAYTGAATFPEPWFGDGLGKVSRHSGLPVLISEFGIRARIDGWSNRGGAGAFVPRADAIDDQLQRGQRYASQMRQFAGTRDVIGAAWHAWSDRFMPANPAVQINLGLLQCTDPGRGMRAGLRWRRLDGLIAEANRTILERVEAAPGL
jgi:hypothetical protein